MMKKADLANYVDYLLGVAMSQSDNLQEAQDLVQETLLAALTT